MTGYQSRPPALSVFDAPGRTPVRALQASDDYTTMVWSWLTAIPVRPTLTLALLALAHLEDGLSEQAAAELGDRGWTARMVAQMTGQPIGTTNDALLALVQQNWIVAVEGVGVPATPGPRPKGFRLRWRVRGAARDLADVDDS